MEIITGKVKSATKWVIYGPEGIGKSTFASKFPKTVFIDTEGSTKHMEVARTQRPKSWTMLIEQVKYFRDNPGLYRTLVIDTADWAEKLCASHITGKAQKDSIEGFGYGKGYTYLMEEFGRLLNLLEEVVDRGINVVVTAHAAIRKFEQPDELGAYDRWELKLEKKVYPLVKEWADNILFANYKTLVVNVDDQGAQKGKNKVQGGARVMYTTHHPCWDAKNRFELKEELPFEFAEIAHILGAAPAATPPPPVAPVAPAPAPLVEPVGREIPPEELKATIDKLVAEKDEVAPEKPKTEDEVNLNLPPALLELMAANNVKEHEIQWAVAEKGYYPSDTPIENYGEDFIKGVLIGAWGQVFKVIEKIRDDIPF